MTTQDRWTSGDCPRRDIFLSEIFRPSTETRVVDWLASLTGDVAITSVTLAELLSGVRKLPDGRRKTALAKSIESVLGQYRGSRSVLPFDEAAAECYADVLAGREGGRAAGCQSQRFTWSLGAARITH